MQDKKPDASTSEDSNLVIVATPEYVKEKIEEHAKSRNHPYATQVEPGFVTLSNETDSDSELTVATSKAVKKASDLANAANQNANNANENANLALPVGVPVPWPTEFAPEGWLICNGDSFDKTRYPKLALAYPEGVLPDLRGEFIRGWDSGRGVDQDRHLMSSQKSANKSHSHEDLGAYGGGPGGNPGTSSIFAKAYTASNYENRPAGGWTGPAYGLTSAPDGETESRPRNIAFNYIVRAA
ncbi:phage tail protein [Xenorhabdus innexi]|uniref:Putative E14 prophage tail fiber protein (Modular protein) n=1 Tax=Xenorhabdus innexi TaxID=290109 RepID=A0A1N6N0Z2_9GAMM|nr:phage tail protein [Xenorhabdus innexi]PHM31342.1 tail protein [Xenorhabdus innexi]SIP74793.1 putative E14 prophage; tail fiber protein (Modular protein) [Xenorhabdus innexi]